MKPPRLKNASAARAPIKAGGGEMPSRVFELGAVAHAPARADISRVLRFMPAFLTLELGL
jgi:hypothetical protein